jgi:uncharacterized membrane protein
MEQNESTLFKLEVEGDSTRFLAETARWGKFLSIIGFIMCGLLVILALFMGTLMGTAFSQIEGAGLLGGGMSILVTIMYLIFAVLYFFPCLYLFRFSDKMKRALVESNQVEMTSAFENLKSCFKFMGIMTIILLSFYALALIFGILGAAFS